MDFDEKDWQNDISTLRDVCVESTITIAVEGSRSGKGVGKNTESRDFEKGGCSGEMIAVKTRLTGGLDFIVS